MLTKYLWFILGFLFHISTAVDWDEFTALDRYVWADDGFFSWEEISVDTHESVTVYVLNMTSQKWMSECYSSRAVWYHEVIVAIPTDIKHLDQGMLIIGGGDNDPSISSSDDMLKMLCVIAASTVGAVVTLVRQVPNQPIVFHHDPSQRVRSENSFVSWTWSDFIKDNGSNPEIVARMPMTKAAKRALDATEEFVYLKTGVQIQKFTVTGASKRGWTTWSLAAVDQRVVAIIPIVMDLLNMKEGMMHHFRSLGGAWSFALADFWYDDVMQHFTEPIIEELFKYEDPMYFKERLDIPKLVLCVTGDVFFLLTDSHDWWSDMPGDNWMMMNPNSSHYLTSDQPMIVMNILTFWKSIITDFPIPELNWEVETFDWGSRLTLTTDTVPLTVDGYTAVTLPDNDRRDFREYAGEPDSIVPQPVVWSKQTVVVVNDFQYQLDVNGVEHEWVGSFIQATYPGPDDMTFTLSTEVAVFPDTYPVGPCQGSACDGHLV